MTSFPGPTVASFRNAHLRWPPLAGVKGPGVGAQGGLRAREPLSNQQPERHPMSSMDDWMRQAAKPGGNKSLTTTLNGPTDQKPEPGQGSGEGGARGTATPTEPTVDSFIRALARGNRGRDAWDLALDADAADMGFVRGHPDADGTINR